MNAEIYRQAAEEHITTAHLLYQENAFVGAFYFAGVTVECIFRAYRYRVDPEFDARHNLYELARASQLLSALNDEQRQQFAADLSDVAVRWSNNHRYRSETALRTFLNNAGLFRIRNKQTLRGNSLEYNGRIMIDAATRIVSLGVLRWQS